MSTRRAEAVALTLCVAYVVGVVALGLATMIAGEGALYAVILAMPGWYVVGAAVFPFLLLFQDLGQSDLLNWALNIFMFAASAALNATCVYLAVRGYLRRPRNAPPLSGAAE